VVAVEPHGAPEARAHLDVELGQELLAHGRLGDAVGHADRVQRPQPFRFRRQQGQAHRLT